MKKIIMALFTMILFVGCIGGKTDVSKEVMGKTYTLISAEKDNPITITFDKEKLSGNSGVNNYFGTYEIKENKIEISKIGSTRKMGPENLMEAETKYLKELTEAKEIKIEKNTLILLTNSGMELKFNKK